MGWERAGRLRGLQERSESKREEEVTGCERRTGRERYRTRNQKPRENEGEGNGKRVGKRGRRRLKKTERKERERAEKSKKWFRLCKRQGKLRALGK